MLWGIDLGGTKIEGAILRSMSDPVPLIRKRINTEAHLGFDHIVNQISNLIHDMAEGGHLPDSIGIGTPGVRDPRTGLMKNCNTVCLNGRDLLTSLQNALPCDVRMANDANCFALAEATFGAGRDKSVVFGVILGTGVGGGLVVNGQIVGGHHGIAGEWGHNVLDPQGEQCYCGKRGCVETILSGPALSRFFARSAGVEGKSLKDIVALMEDDTALGESARTCVNHLVESFGRAMSVVVNIVDPDAIVIGGGVGNIDALYTQGRLALQRNVFNDTFEAELLRPIHGDSAGVLGAALLCEA